MSRNGITSELMHRSTLALPLSTPRLHQINLVVRDMDATVGFYRRLGLEIEDGYRPEHVAVPVANGLTIEFDATDFVPMWDAGWRGGTGGSTVLSFECRTREAVDELFEDLTAAGYAAHQRPYDAFWGARYAIVEDPDGNGVGLMSPIDRGRKSWPPRRPATA